jgi:hypothetical protein
VGRGTDDRIWINTRDFDAWSGWSPLRDASGIDNRAREDPAIASWGPGHLDVIVKSDTPFLLVNTYESGGLGWAGWQVTKHVAGFVNGVSAISIREGRIDVIGRAGDGTAMTTTYGDSVPGGP